MTFEYATFVDAAEAAEWLVLQFNATIKNVRPKYNGGRDDVWIVETVQNQIEHTFSAPKPTMNGLVCYKETELAQAKEWADIFLSYEKIVRVRLDPNHFVLTIIVTEPKQESNKEKEADVMENNNEAKSSDVQNRSSLERLNEGIRNYDNYSAGQA